MGNFSRDTFDKLKHYVGVRLQQGVPLVDADWNEQEDIRRYELQAFLKWFVGNGVPEGNDGFRIISIVNKIILTSNKNDDGVSSVEVNQEKSTAVEILGFGSGNYLASRAAPPAAQLTGEVAGPFKFKEEGLTLVVSADGMEEETVTFKKGNFTAAEVVAAINSAMSNLTASAGTGNDFDIKGGDGTAEGAGRCLVEGWDVINESDLKYSAQPLFENETLAEEWGVDPVNQLTTPTTDRTDTVYLDVWEREVGAAEDNDLFNRDIGVGVETCVRLKREWVVRVAEGATATELPTPSDGHVYYPLATLTRPRDEQAIDSKHITDLRRTGVNVTALADEIADARGTISTLEAEIADARGIKGNMGNRLDESLAKGGQLRHNVVGGDQIGNGAVSIANLSTTLVLDAERDVSAAAEGEPGVSAINIQKADEHAFYLISVLFVRPASMPRTFKADFNWKRGVLFNQRLSRNFVQLLYFHQLLIENPNSFDITVSCKVYRLNER